MNGVVCKHISRKLRCAKNASELGLSDHSKPRKSAFILIHFILTEMASQDTAGVS